MDMLGFTATNAVRRYSGNSAQDASDNRMQDDSLLFLFRMNWRLTVPRLGFFSVHVYGYRSCISDVTSDESVISL